MDEHALTSYADALGEDTLAIYLFHGVVERQSHPVRNYTLKHVEAAPFRGLIEELAERGTPLSIDGAVDALSGSAELPQRAFVVSFDDGFRNNYTVAAPILETAGVPAVFYVTTGFVENGTASWIDMIEFAVERCDLSRLTVRSVGLDLPIRTTGEKIAALDALRLLAKARREIDPYKLAGEIRHVTGVTGFEPDPHLDAKLSWDEVAELGKHSLFTVGGHSHTHRIMSFLTPEELDFEVRRSVELLSDALGEPLRHYSYPEGMKEHYSPSVIARLKEAGVVCSPSAVPGVNRVGDDPFELKRVWVP